MKKLFITLLAAFLLCQHAQARSDGGAVAAGAIGGLVLGSMLTTVASDSHRTSRVEEKLNQSQREQDKEVGQLKREIDKRELETKLLEQKRHIEEQKLLEQQRLAEQRQLEQQRLTEMQRERERGNTTMTILFVMLGIMFLIIIGLGVYIVTRRKHE